MQCITDFFMVEAIVATQALEFAFNMGFKDIELEEDAFGIVKKNSLSSSLSFSIASVIVLVPSPIVVFPKNDDKVIKVGKGFVHQSSSI